jgi:YNFM family putative membrane transporter
MNTKPHQHSSGLTGQLVACALAVVAQLYLPMPVLGALAAEFGMLPAQAGYALTAFSVPYAFGFLVFGPLSDHIGRCRVMSAGLVALSVSSLLLQIAETPTAFLGLRAVQGFAAAAFPPVALAYLAERGTPKQRVWGVAWMSTAFLSAGLLGQMYGALIVPLAGFSRALIPLCVVYLFTAAWLWQGPAGEAHRTSPGKSTGLRFIVVALRDVMGDPQLRRVYGPALVLLLCFVAFYLGLDARLGASLQQLGFNPLAVRLVALPGFFAPLAVAALMPRFGPQRMASAGLTVATAGLALAALMAVMGGPMLVLVASLLLTAGIGVTVPSLIARVAAVALPHCRGMAIAFYTFILFIGASLGPWLAGRSSLLEAGAFFGLLAALMAFAAVISWHQPPAAARQNVA